MKHHSTTFFCKSGSPLTAEVTHNGDQTEWPVLLKISENDCSEAINIFLASELQLAAFRNYVDLACDAYFSQRAGKAVEEALEKSANA